MGVELIDTGLTFLVESAFHLMQGWPLSSMEVIFMHADKNQDVLQSCSLLTGTSASASARVTPEILFFKYLVK